MQAGRHYLPPAVHHRQQVPHLQPLGLPRPAQEILGPGAFVSFTMTLGPQGELEPVWEVGVQTREHSRDLWGQQGSLEAALHEANTAKKSSSVVRTGGRR